MLTLKNDLLFKAVYGREDEKCKQALIAVLNLILDRKEDPIVRIHYRNPFNVRKFETQKESVLDIKVETGQGELLDLEIHLLYDKNFIAHGIYYHAGMVLEALEPGQNYGMMKKTISIFITDYVQFAQTDRYHTTFCLMERQDLFPLTDLVEMHWLELAKVNPARDKTVSQMSQLERYLEYLRYAGDPSEEAYLTQLRRQGGKEIDMTERLLKEATAEQIIREQAIAREKFIMRQKSREQQERETQEALRETENSLKKTREALGKTEKDLEKTEETLAQTEKNLEKTEDSLAQTEETLAQTEENLEKTEDSLAQTEETLAQTEE
ncbi:Rpn family recombination-promoting nuclease/putative transposase, partial [Anaerovorax odorimutans]